MSWIADQPILNATLRIRWGDAASSAVYFRVGDSPILVTAAHCVHGIVANNNIALRYKGEWGVQPVADVEFAGKGADVCGLRLANNLGAGLLPERLNGDVFQGEDVAFCGFPLGLEMSDVAEQNGWPVAFVKKGSVSGFLKVASGPLTVFDALNNVGFSGGPIVRRNVTSKVIEVIGIVSAYKPDAKLPVMKRSHQDGEDEATPDYYVTPNSGFMYGETGPTIRGVIDALVARAPPSTT